MTCGCLFKKKFWVYHLRQALSAIPQTLPTSVEFHTCTRLLQGIRRTTRTFLDSQVQNIHAYFWHLYTTCMVVLPELYTTMYQYTNGFYYTGCSNNWQSLSNDDSMLCNVHIHVLIKLHIWKLKNQLYWTRTTYKSENTRAHWPLVRLAPVLLRTRNTSVWYFYCSANR